MRWLSRLQGHLQLDQYRECVADGDERVDPLDQERVHSAAVGSAPEDGLPSQDGPCCFRLQRLGQALADASVLDQDVLSGRRVLHAHLGAFQTDKEQILQIAHCATSSMELDGCMVARQWEAWRNVGRCFRRVWPCEGKRSGPDGKRFGPDGKCFGADGKRFGLDGKRFDPDGKCFGAGGKRFDPDGKRSTLRGEASWLHESRSARCAPSRDLPGEASCARVGWQRGLGVVAEYRKRWPILRQIRTLLCGFLCRTPPGVPGISNRGVPGISDRSVRPIWRARRFSSCFHTSPALPYRIARTITSL